MFHLPCKRCLPEVTEEVDKCVFLEQFATIVDTHLSDKEAEDGKDTKCVLDSMIRFSVE
jgi:hypothetical protein